MLVGVSSGRCSRGPKRMTFPTLRPLDEQPVSTASVLGRLCADDINGKGVGERTGPMQISSLEVYVRHLIL